MSFKIEANYYGNKFKIFMFLLGFSGIFIALYSSFILGQAINLYIIDFSYNLFHFFLFLIFSVISCFFFLQTLALLVLAKPYLIIDESGIARSGQGFRRDVIITWDNIKEYKIYNSKNSIVRVWIKEPIKAWKIKNPIYKVFNWFFRLISFGVLKFQIEQQFIQFTSTELNLKIEQLSKILDKQTHIAAFTNGKTEIEISDHFQSKLPTFANLIYLLPLLMLFISLNIRL